MNDSSNDALYWVVINHEEQYSIWETWRGEPPKGWSKIGDAAPKEACLDQIEAVWTDMRPLSLRKAMDRVE